MGRAHTESKTHTFKQNVTFITGFGVVADEPINIGSPTSSNTDLVIHNKLKFAEGSTSNFELSDLPSAPAADTYTYLVQDDKGVVQKTTTGAKGEKGPKGQKGTDGVLGGDGQKGEKGGAGTQGVKGATGAGDKGQKGQKGGEGSQGAKGQKGQIGDKGQKVKLA